MATMAGQPQPYTEADVFIAQFLTGNPKLSMAEAGRQAYHAARSAGFDSGKALYVEARVYDTRKLEIAETRRQRGEWLVDFQQAGLQ